MTLGARILLEVLKMLYLSWMSLVVHLRSTRPSKVREKMKILKNLKYRKKVKNPSKQRKCHHRRQINQACLRMSSCGI